MRFLAFVVFVLGSSIGAASSDIYVDAYSEITEFQDAGDGVGYFGFWWPLGEDDPEFGKKRPKLTDSEQSDLESALKQCVANLRDKNDHPPTRSKSVAAVQIVQCMNIEGWSLRYMTVVSPDRFHKH